MKQALVYLPFALLFATKVVAQSQWEGPYNTSITVAAAANRPDGKIVAWSAWARMDYSNRGEGQTYTVVVDPSTTQVTEQLITNTDHDMFCPGTAILPDGLLMVTGGSSNKRVSYYNYQTNSWFKGKPMILRRGYHSMTVLGDGSVFTVGGSWLEGAGGTGGKYAELFKDGEWTARTGIQAEPLSTNDKRGPYRADNHMWLYTAPSGLIFHAGPAKQMHWLDVNGNNGDGSLTLSLLRGNDGDAMNGNAVMFDQGKILTCGGAPNYSGGSQAIATTNAYVIDINGGVGGVTVTQTGSMNRPRALHNSVVLPTGEVVTVGGQEESRIFQDAESVFEAEIWNPLTGQWTLLSPMVTPRNYHSVALLMKDGRVWVAGGGLCGLCLTNHPDYEVLTPPYLMTGAPRPVIISATETIVYLGNPAILTQPITVTMSTAGFHSFALIRLSSATHSVDNDVRRISLPSATQNGVNWIVDVTANRNIAIPGEYFLFAMDTNGVPSVAVIVTIEGEDDGPYEAPDVPTASPSAETCWPQCGWETGARWVCGKPNGCGGCSEVQETCQKLCSRCEGRANNQYGGLDCICEEEPCWGVCEFETNGKWICSNQVGCTGCEQQTTCDKLCNRCENEPVKNYGGLDCNCGAGPTPTVAPLLPTVAPSFPTVSPSPPTVAPSSPTVAPSSPTAAPSSPTARPTAEPSPGALSPPSPALPCWGVCEFEQKGKWICSSVVGCEGCEKVATCNKLCNRCAGRDNNSYGGLDCDCTATELPCLSVCEFQQQGKWICPVDTGCEGCEQAGTCTKLCNRCDGLEANKYGGLNCECTENPGHCFDACAYSSGGKWVCSAQDSCAGCNAGDVCANMCNRCGLTGSQSVIAGLTCDCS